MVGHLDTMYVVHIRYVIHAMYAEHAHMCLVGPLNPYILLQSWELTFLIGLTLLNTKLAKKKFFTYILKRYGDFTMTQFLRVYEISFSLFSANFLPPECQMYRFSTL